MGKRFSTEHIPCHLKRDYERLPKLVLVLEGLGHSPNKSSLHVGTQLEAQSAMDAIAVDPLQAHFPIIFPKMGSCETMDPKIL